MMKRLAIHTILVLPFLYLLIQLFIVEVNDPIKYIYTISGITATVILFFSITISLIKRKMNLMKYRRAIGLWGFFYALVHTVNFVIFDAQFDIYFIFEETLDKPFIYLGVIAFLILIFMAITSTKNLFRKYGKYHTLVYLALVLITIHFVMAQKSIDIDLFCYIVVILIIAYYKLLQVIVRNSKVI